MTTLKAVTTIRRDTLELEDRLELLLADIRADEVAGLAVVICEVNGRVRSWHLGNTNRLLGGASRLMHKLNQEPSADD